MVDSELVVRSIKKRYITGLIIIGLSACASFVCLRLALMRSQSTALIVNISGRQRMLSQRIALDALKFSKSYSQNLAALRKDALADIHCIQLRCSLLIKSCLQETCLIR